MLTIPLRTVRAIGEAMIELAPVGDGVFRRGFAGDTFNTAWHIARLVGGVVPVGMVSRIGQDQLSCDFAAEMGADGLDVTGVSVDPVRRMGLYLIELNGVERSFHYWRDTSAARLLADDPARLADGLAGAGLIHLSGITLAILSPAARNTLFAALAVARDAGAVVSFDPNIRPRLWASPAELHSTIGLMLALTDIALPSFDDESTHFSDTSPTATLNRMGAAGVREIVVKNGAGPVCLRVDGVDYDLPTPAVTDIKDTTGAGDAFNAGYLAARLLGHDPGAAVRQGQRLAGLVIGHFGARAPKDVIPVLAHNPDP